MTDFLTRESELLGEEFTGTPTGGTYATAGGEIDFDRAASAFPDISLDGSGDIPSPTVAAPPSKTSGFSFDDFDSPPMERVTEVKVTGDDEIEKFENEFPDIEVPQVGCGCICGRRILDAFVSAFLVPTTKPAVVWHGTDFCSTAPALCLLFDSHPKSHSRGRRTPSH